MYEILVNESVTTPSVTGDFYNNKDWTTWPSTTWYTYPTTVYMYQIICPKPRCKTSNWLEIDKMKECTKCGSMLKAVRAKADYEVEVE